MTAPNALGPYSLLKKLATGAALDTHLARPAGVEAGSEVVVRRIRRQLSQKDEVVAIFRREVEVAAQLEHPGLGQVFQFSETDAGDRFVVVEFVWGEDLRRIAERGMTVGRFMPVELAVRVAAEVAEALSHVHDAKDAASGQSFAHHHVSPSNVMVAFDGQVKLVNLGLARAEQQVAETVKQRRLQLKYAYMSPEQAEGGNVDARSDLFSLGTVLYEFTTRKRLFKGSDGVSTMKLVAEASVKAPSETVPSYPPALERIVLKVLAKNPADRYQTALELRDDLLGFLEESKKDGDREQLAKYMRGIFPDRIKEYERLLGDGYSGPSADLRSVVAAQAQAAPATPKAKPEPAKEAAKKPAAKPKKPSPPPAPAQATPAKPPPPPPPKDKAPALPQTPTLPPLKLKPDPEPEPEPEPVEATGADAEAAAPEDADTDYASETFDSEDTLDEDIDAAVEELSPARPPMSPARMPLPSGVEPFDAADADNDTGSQRAIPTPELLSGRRDSDSLVISAVHTLRKDLPDAFEEAAATSRTVIKWVAAMMAIVLGVIVWYGLTYQWPWEDAPSRSELPPVEPRARPTPPATIPVMVQSEPAGAAVSVNGIIAQERTPAQLQLVPDAPNTLVFYMDGFGSRVLDVPIGAQAPPEGLSVTLDEIVEPPDWEPPPPDPDSQMPPITQWSHPMGRVRVLTDPSDATIIHNGRDVCRSPCVFEVHANQEQHLVARLPNYLDTVSFVRARVFDAENDTLFVNMQLRQPPPSGQLYSYLAIESAPDGARIRVDDEASGRTQSNYALRIEDLHRVELELADHHTWARSFYPGPGRYEITAIMDRIRRDPAQLSLYVDTPGLEQTVIYLGPNEIGVGSVEHFQIDGGTYEVTLSYRPPPDSGERRRSSQLEVELPIGQHITEHYTWDGERFALVERTQGPLVNVDRNH